MTEYELCREIFNNCSGNQMRDVDFSEVETDDVDAYVRQFLGENDVITSRDEVGDGIIFNVNSSGMLQRFSFTKI